MNKSQDKIPITKAVVMEIALRIFRTQLEATIPNEAERNTHVKKFENSLNGFVRDFLKKHGWRYKKLHGEGGGKKFACCERHDEQMLIQKTHN